MNCEQAQEAILLSDNPAGPHGDAAVNSHVAECSACQTFIQKLVRLESAAAALPAPGLVQAKQAALEKSRLLLIRPRRTFLLRPAFLSAVAALLVIGIGLGIYLYNTSRPAPPTVVDRLIDWNLQLADAPVPTDRDAIFAARAAVLESEVKSESLTDEDRQLASNLLEHGTWMCVNTDPLDRAEKFSDLAELILLRMHRAAANNNLKALQQLSRRYDLVVQAGIGGNVARMRQNGNLTPENRKKLERIEKRNAEQLQRLEAMADRAPKALQRELKAASEANQRQVRNLKRPAKTF